MTQAGRIDSTKLLPALLSIQGNLIQNGISQNSALGVWCLAAYLGQAFTNEERPKKLSELVGMESDEAYKIIDSLVHHSPDNLAVAFSGWIDPKEKFNYVDALFKNTGSISENGNMPTQDEADLWVKEKSLGILESFPVSVDDLVAAFNNMIATELLWSETFNVTKSSATFKEAWDVDEVLLSTMMKETNVVEFEGQNYAVHQKSNSDSNITVYSVLALDELPDESIVVPLAAYSIVVGKAGESSNRNIPVSKYVKKTPSSETSRHAQLPAWEADSSVSLADIFPEFAEVSKMFSTDRGAPSDVIQVVKAAYNTNGFKAAGLTTAVIGRSVAVTQNYRHTFEYAKPYAVVATAIVDGTEIPIFNFWVDKAIEPEAPNA